MSQSFIEFPVAAREPQGLARWEPRFTETEVVSHRKEHMSLPEYEYKGLMAQAWDVLRGDTSNWPDRFFFLDLIQTFGQPVLDVGCGTGRLILDYLRQGVDIEGLDNSPEMLALCRHKATTLGLAPILYEQYLETVSLPRQYRTILIPSSTLQLLIEPAMVKQALDRLYAHVLPGGAVVAPFMTLWKTGDPLSQEWEQMAVRMEDGATFRRVGRYWYDPGSECTDTEDCYQVIMAQQVVTEEVHRRSPATRSYTQAQARSLFESSGFNPIELYSGFTFEPVKADDTLFTVVGHKAARP
jgi:ubiquinone/menaquinone biosynthesis C-methylase UbiE